MSLWICGHIRLLQLSNFDFQDVLQHSLKSTMDFWYKFIQPQTFSFAAFFSLSLILYLFEIKSRNKWYFSFSEKQKILKFNAWIGKVCVCVSHRFLRKCDFSLNQANLFNFPLWWFSKNNMRNDEFD